MKKTQSAAHRRAWYRAEMARCLPIDELQAEDIGRPGQGIQALRTEDGQPYCTLFVDDDGCKAVFDENLLRPDECFKIKL